VTFSTLFIAYLVAVAAATAIVARTWLDSREAITTLSVLAVWLAFTGWLGLQVLSGSVSTSFLLESLCSRFRS
jgi:hypothetical protein